MYISPLVLQTIFCLQWSKVTKLPRATSIVRLWFKLLTPRPLIHSYLPCAFINLCPLNKGWCLPRSSFRNIEFFPRRRAGKSLFSGLGFFSTANAVQDRESGVWFWQTWTLARDKMRSMKEIAFLQPTDWLRETVGWSFRACNDMRGCEQIFEMKSFGFLTRALLISHQLFWLLRHWKGK